MMCLVYIGSVRIRVSAEFIICTPLRVKLLACCREIFRRVVLRVFVSQHSTGYVIGGSITPPSVFGCGTGNEGANPLVPSKSPFTASFRDGSLTLALADFGMPAAKWVTP